MEKKSMLKGVERRKQRVLRLKEIKEKAKLVDIGGGKLNATEAPSISFLHSKTILELLPKGLKLVLQPPLFPHLKFIPSEKDSNLRFTSSDIIQIHDIQDLLAEANLVSNGHSIEGYDPSFEPEAMIMPRSIATSKKTNVKKTSSSDLTQPTKESGLGTAMSAFKQPPANPLMALIEVEAPIPISQFPIQETFSSTYRTKLGLVKRKSTTVASPSKSS
ncbi:hypothetical protein ACH5RR_015270 [Cinchona calisaya]|uniref:Uncharacterized protein n=1 Tax=Cinchona calisaya TaxID=153742 RepID=A0ABD2ZSM6_9GENT